VLEGALPPPLVGAGFGAGFGVGVGAGRVCSAAFSVEEGGGALQCVELFHRAWWCGTHFSNLSSVVGRAIDTVERAM
jgi:hypothetical protein